jgi:hypothetical protein
VDVAPALDSTGDVAPAVDVAPAADVAPPAPPAVEPPGEPLLHAASPTVDEAPVTTRA